MNPCSNVRRAAILLLLSAATPTLAAPAGSLDPTFDMDGKQTIGFNIGGYNNDEVTAMALAPGGRVYLAGILRRTTSNYAIGISRLRHDGTIDSAFGTDGRVVIDVVDGRNVALAAAIQPDGKLVLVGWAEATGETKASMLICRTLTNGDLDTGFGNQQTPGCRIFSAPASQFSQAVLVQPDGRIVVAMRRYPDGVMLLRLEPDGSDDTSFGLAGTTLLGGQFGDSGLLSIDRMPDGDLVAAGYTRINAFDEEDVLLFRVDEHGEPDESFGAGGAKVITINAGSSAGRRGEYARRVHALADGTVIATGALTSDNNPDFTYHRSRMPFALKLDQDGELDASFGGGVVLHDPCLTPCSSESADSVVLPDGRIVLAGVHSDVTTPLASEFLAMRLLPNGDPDPEFGDYSAGVASIDFALVDNSVSDDRANRIALDGARLVLGGTAVVPSANDDQSVDRDFAVVRLDHGLEETFFQVSSESLGSGALSPDAQQNVTHSDHVDFELTPALGYRIATVEGCDGALYGKVYTTGPIVADCTVTATFELKPDAMFSDGFEPQG